jgi:hypothetical protein
MSECEVPVVVIEVTGGRVDITKITGDARIYLVDWDSPHSGACAYCDAPLTDDDHDGKMHNSCRDEYERVKGE